MGDFLSFLRILLLYSYTLPQFFTKNQIFIQKTQKIYSILKFTCIYKQAG